MSEKKRMNMSNERQPRHIFTEGDHNFEVMNIINKMSKANNEMYVVSLQEINTTQTEEVYMVATEGKRWLLKSFLDACGITPDKDCNNDYVWEESDCIGKLITATFIHEPNEYINRIGETVKTVQHKIIKIKEYVPNAVEPETKKIETWDDDKDGTQP